MFSPGKPACPSSLSHRGGDVELYSLATLFVNNVPFSIRMSFMMKVWHPSAHSVSTMFIWFVAENKSCQRSSREELKRKHGLLTANNYQNNHLKVVETLILWILLYRRKKCSCHRTGRVSHYHRVCRCFALTLGQAEEGGLLASLATPDIDSNNKSL